MLTSQNNQKLADVKKTEDNYQEMVMMNQKLNRHEKWIQQLAAKLEIKLEY